MKKEKNEKIVLTTAKKKKAIARVRLSAGLGIIKINGTSLKVFKPIIAGEIISEPLVLAQKILGNDFASNLDIYINAHGGGVMGQAYAARTAIGKALVKWTQNEDLKKLFLEYDRSLIIDDVRKKEPKKYLRKGARAKWIKSYR